MQQLFKLFFYTPPFLFFMTLTLQVIIYYFFPNEIKFWNIFIGATFFIEFFLLSSLAAKKFLDNRTTITIYNLEAKKVIKDGVFSISRNPMYLSLILLLFSFGSLFCPYALVITIPLFYLSLLPEIKREEKFLTAKFGEEYTDYCTKVNRWL